MSLVLEKSSDGLVEDEGAMAGTEEVARAPPSKEQAHPFMLFDFQRIPIRNGFRVINTTTQAGVDSADYVAMCPSWLDQGAQPPRSSPFALKKALGVNRSAGLFRYWRCTEPPSKL